jgi:hypothetical protein
MLSLLTLPEVKRKAAFDRSDKPKSDEPPTILLQRNTRLAGLTYSLLNHVLKKSPSNEESLSQKGF